MTLLAALVGLLGASGLWLIADGLRPRHRGEQERRPRRITWSRDRLLRATALGLPSLVLTRWPVVGFAMGALGWFSVELFGSRRAQDRDTARTEAIASWTEMLRDTMSGAHGLEEAISTSAVVAPEAIRVEVTGLAVRVERERLDVALREFSDELAHPTADLVVSALGLAAQGSVGDLNELLGTLAVAARDEAAMRLRIDAARARLRTAVRVIAGVTAATALGLVLLNRSYLDVYSSGVGQVVLAAIAVAWGVGLWWLARMGRFIAPERFLTASDKEVNA